MERHFSKKDKQMVNKHMMETRLLHTRMFKWQSEGAKCWQGCYQSTVLGLLWECRVRLRWEASTCLSAVKYGVIIWPCKLIPTHTGSRIESRCSHGSERSRRHCAGLLSRLWKRLLHIVLNVTELCTLGEFYVYYIITQ